MPRLVVDSDNYAAHGVETMFFPGGEPHVKIPDFRGKRPFLFLKLRNWNDVGLAALLMDALQCQEVGFDAFIPYFPGARQDRSDGHSPFTARVMAQLLGHRAGRLYVFDAHSIVTLKNTNSINLMPSELNDVWPEGYFDGIISPDRGAADRAENFRLYRAPGSTLIQCDKKRDFQSGKFTGYNMPALKFPGRYLIVDDICDGGGTFNLLAEAFKNDPIGKDSELQLWVSHGIFSRGLENIDSKIDHIYTTDSFCQLESTDRLTVFPLLSNLKGFFHV